MNWFWIILLIVVGLFLLVLEIIAIPGTTIAGIFGLALYGFAIYSAYDVYGATAGHITLFSSLFFGVLMFIYFLRSKAWNRFKLKTEIESKVNVIDETKITLGSTGKTLSRLAPSGKAIFGDEVAEVHAQNELIDPETEVKVVKIEGYKITVKRVNENEINID